MVLVNIPGTPRDLVNDAWDTRLFESEGFEMFLCQSFAKNWEYERPAALKRAAVEGGVGV